MEDFLSLLNTGKGILLALEGEFDSEWKAHRYFTSLRARTERRGFRARLLWIVEGDRSAKMRIG